MNQVGEWVEHVTTAQPGERVVGVNEEGGRAQNGRARPVWSGEAGRARLGEREGRGRTGRGERAWASEE